MAFGDSVLECVGLKNELSRCPFRITVFGEEGVLVGGVKKIAKISDSEVAFLTAKRKITIIGSNLKISAYDEKEASVKGVIAGVSLEQA